MAYDSKQDTIDHIAKVQDLLQTVIIALADRGLDHDKSKLEDPEKFIFDKFTPKLKGTTYGSKEYNGYLDAMGGALQHHYAHNQHHPEYHTAGIDGMTLIDIIEMFCDWKAATLRHDDGDMKKSIVHNASRFGISKQLEMIFENTREVLDW